MMATTHITHSHFFPSNKLLFFTAVPQPRRYQLRHLHGGTLAAGVFASSPTKTSVARRRQGRSNVDLCNDLREFISLYGLPDGHVPSLKELSENGRQDLANLVRRRGYKLIGELLGASQEIEVTDSDVDRSLTEYKAINKEDESTGLDENGNTLAEEVILSDKDTIVEETSSTETYDGYTESDGESHILVDDLTKSSLQEKVERFIQTGELEDIEDDDLGIVNENERSQNSTKLQLSSASEESKGQVLCVSDSDNSTNGSFLISQLVNSNSNSKLSFAVTSATLPTSSVYCIYSRLNFKIMLNDSLIFICILCRNITSDDQLESSETTLTDENVKVEIRTKEDEAEINRIKVMLHHKELELSQLKEQTEKIKQALSELQAIAETEISKAQKLVLDKDAELLAAEERLYGLKQVQLEYWGDGETVEVAGSFNGWHHGVKLDPQPSSNITDPVELRNTKLWRSILWLYPGIYEIKFIVDGKWMIDPMKEVVYRGSIANNVLRVDRS